MSTSGKGTAASGKGDKQFAQVLDQRTGLHRELSLFNGFVSPHKVGTAAEVLTKEVDGGNDDLAIINLREQYEFFVFAKRYFRDYELLTRLPPSTSWREKSAVYGLHRSKNTKNVDAALGVYHEELDRVNKIVANSRIAFRDTAANPSHTTIDFAYPPFAECRFTIGSWAAVEPGLIFRQLPDSRQWSEGVLSGALRSAAVAKELMQSCPDLEQMMMTSEEESRRAKRIMHRDQLTALHNLTISAYLLDSQSSPAKLMKPGDRVPWSSFLDTQTDNRNDRFLKDDIVYLYSPSFDEVSRMNPDKERVLTDPLRWLAIFREMQSERLRLLCKLLEAIAEWLSAHSAKKKTSDRAVYVDELTLGVQEEVAKVHQLLSRMPASRALSEVIRTENRDLQVRRGSFEGAKSPTPQPRSLRGRRSDARRRSSLQLPSRNDLFKQAHGR